MSDADSYLGVFVSNLLPFVLFRICQFMLFFAYLNSYVPIYIYLTIIFSKLTWVISKGTNLQMESMSAPISFINDVDSLLFLHRFRLLEIKLMKTLFLHCKMCQYKLQNILLQLFLFAFSIRCREFRHNIRFDMMMMLMMTMI